MGKIKIGIICPSEMAFCRFMPSIQKRGHAEYIGVAHAGGHVARWEEQSGIRAAQWGNGYEVDIYGIGALVNDKGVTAQVSFGMDNSYKWELEIWGSKGFLWAGRIFTALAGFTPTAEITTAEGTEMVQLPEDDSFLASIERFCRCVHDRDVREENCWILNRQAELVKSFRTLASSNEW